MPKTHIEGLDEIVETALDNREPGVSLKRAAAELFDAEETLLIPLFHEWGIEKLVSLLRKKSVARAREMQPMLPGFERLPQSISKRDGGRKKLIRSTLRDLVGYKEAMYRKWKDNEKRGQVERLITLMRKHPTHGITVGEVLELEGIEPKLKEEGKGKKGKKEG